MPDDCFDTLSRNRNDSGDIFVVTKIIKISMINIKKGDYRHVVTKTKNRKEYLEEISTINPKSFRLYNMTYNEKKSLYESIMLNVAKIVKRHINELSLVTVNKALRKQLPYSFDDSEKYDLYDNYTKSVEMKLQSPRYGCDTVSAELSTFVTEDEDEELYKIFMVLTSSTNSKYFLEVLGIITRKGEVYEVSHSDANVKGYNSMSNNNDPIINHKLYWDEFRQIGIQDAKKFAQLVNEETGLKVTYRLFSDGNK